MHIMMHLAVQMFILIEFAVCAQYMYPFTTFSSILYSLFGPYGRKLIIDKCFVSL